MLDLDKNKYFFQIAQKYELMILEDDVNHFVQYGKVRISQYEEISEDNFAAPNAFGQIYFHK